MLSGTVYGYWYFTNGRRARRLAEHYLRDLTGADVHVRRVNFRLFGNVELEDVSVRVPGDNSPDPLFRARKVILSHRPWDTIFAGRLYPTEIVCLEPVVNIEYYQETGDYNNVAKLEQLAQKKRASLGAAGQLVTPPIRVRNCKIRAFRGRPRRFQGEVCLAMTLLPKEEGYYDAFVEEEGKVGRRLEARWHYSVQAGRPIQGVASGPILHIARALPPAYAELLERYFTRGNFSRSWDPNSKDDRIPVTVSDAAVKFPPELGPLELEDVGGTIVFLQNKRMMFEKLTGRVASPGSGQFEVRGWYGGEGSQAEYEITVKVVGLTIPALSGGGELAAALRQIQETYKPSGKIDVSMTLKQVPGRARAVEGTIVADGLSARYKYFPYPLENVRGTIEFTTDTVRITKLNASHGPAEFSIAGCIEETGGETVYDVTIISRNLPMDETLKGALQPGAASVYNDLSPEGFANIRTHISKVPGQSEKVTLVFLDGGNLTASHRFFPYRVKIDDGCVHIQGGDVIIPSPYDQTSDLPEQEQLPVRGRRGQMECLIYGRATGLDTDKPNLDFTIEADKVPLDDVLLRAIQPHARSALGALNATGVLRGVNARLRQSGKSDVDVKVTGRLENMNFRHTGFPYAVRDAVCSFAIDSDRIDIKELAGRHGPTAVTVSGQMFLGEKEAGADLRMRLSGVVFDDDFLAAMGPAVREIWEKVAPVGAADVVVRKFRQNTPANPGQTDYEVAVIPRDMTIGFAGVPYRFRIGHSADAATEPAEGQPGNSGEIVATPGKVAIRQLRSVPSQKGAILDLLDGEVSYDDKSVEVRMAIKARNLPLDAEHIEAVQKGRFPLAARMKPGGSFDVDLKEIVAIRTVAKDETRQGDRAVATRPADGKLTKMDVSGSVSLRDVIVAFGTGQSSVSGTIKGYLGSGVNGLTIEGELVDLDLMVNGNRPVRRVNGHFGKYPGKPLQIREISGEACGGRLEGQAVARLEKPMQYRLRANFEGLRLEELLNIARKRKGDKVELLGVVEGTMEMSGGDDAERRASGQLRITKAKFVELPVMLGLLQVVSLSLPSDRPYAEGLVEYDMKGNLVVFREIYLGGPAASLVGSGKMDVKTGKLNLTFVTGSRPLPRLKSIEELRQGIIGEIAEVIITGTLEKPSVRTVPLRSVKAIIDTLTRPESAGD
jgi:hypothetical protein